MSLEHENAMLRLQVCNLEHKVSKLEADLRWAQVSPVIAEAAIAQGATKASVADILDRAQAAGAWEIRKNRAVLVKEGFVAIGNDGSDVTATSFVKSLTPTAPHLFGQPTNGGGDAGPNPWLPATWNLTDQGRILRENPALARKLAAAAGAKLPAMAD